MRTPSRPMVRLILTAAALALAGSQRLPASAMPDVVRPATASSRPGRSAASGVAASVPIVKAHQYRMNGKIRPLLFWIGKSGVGSGEIVWRSDGSGARAWELLIGSDPARAPRKLNRWGYIVEAAEGGQVHVVGLMSTSEEASLSDVERDLSATSAHSRFKTIAATVTNGTSSTVTGTIDAGRDVTLHDASMLVDTAQRAMAGVPPRVNEVPADVRPGFLSSVAELVDLTLAASSQGQRAVAALEGTSVAYVYGVKTFDLVLTSVSTPRRSSSQAPANAPVLQSAFEIRPHAGGGRHRFELEYVAGGELAGVPSRIRYQPRWWLQLELTLDVTGGPTAARGLVR